MSSNTASYVVRLVDRVTRPARIVAASLGRINKVMERMQRSKAFAMLNRGVDRVAGWAKTAAIGIAAAGAAIGATVVGMTVHMARFSESSRLAFKYLYGGGAAGERAFDTSIRLARALGQDVEEVTGQFIQLRAAQFTLGESEEVFKLAADLKALTGDAEKAKRAVTAITQIKAKGKLQAEELVGQLAESGVATTLVYESLAKTLGKTQDQVRKMITAGKISADVGIAAIKDAVKHKIGEGALGDFALEKARNTLGGAFDRLLNAPKLFFLRVAREAGPAMKTIRNSINNAIGAIEALNPTGFAHFVSDVASLLPNAISLMREFASGFGDGFSEVLQGITSLSGAAGDQRQLWHDFGRSVAKGFALAFEVLEGIAKVMRFLETPAGKIMAAFTLMAAVLVKIVLIGKALAPLVGFAEAIVGGIASALPVIGTVLGTIASGIGAVLTAIGAIVGLPAIAVAAIIAAVAAAGIAIYTYWDEIMAFFVSAEQWLEDAGGRMIEGLVIGLVAGWARVKESVVSLVESIVGTVRDVLKISSPSRVMRELGAYTAQGFTMGLQSEQALTGDSGGALDAFSADAASPASRSIVQNDNRRVNVTVNVGAGAKMREVRSAVVEGMRQALDRGGEYSGA